MAGEVNELTAPPSLHELTASICDDSFNPPLCCGRGRGQIDEDLVSMQRAACTISNLAAGLRSYNRKNVVARTKHFGQTTSLAPVILYLLLHYRSRFWAVEKAIVRKHARSVMARAMRTAIPRLRGRRFQNSAASSFLCRLRFSRIVLKREHLLECREAVSNRMDSVGGAHLRQHVANSLYRRTHRLIAINNHGNLAQFVDYRLDEARIVCGH